MKLTMKIWYLECLLPSAAQRVTSAEMAAIIKKFQNELGDVGGIISKEFGGDESVDAGVVIQQSFNAAKAIMNFADNASLVVRQHGDDPDQVYIMSSDNVHAGGLPADKQIWPVKGKTHDFAATNHIKFGASATDPDQVAPTVVCDTDAHAGVVVYDKDTFSKDDVVFTLLGDLSFRTDTTDGTQVAVDEKGKPILASDKVKISTTDTFFPSALNGKMFNDVTISNVEQDSVYRVIWTLEAA